MAAGGDRVALVRAPKFLPCRGEESDPIALRWFPVWLVQIGSHDFRGPELAGSYGRKIRGQAVRILRSRKCAQPWNVHSRGLGRLCH